MKKQIAIEIIVFLFVVLLLYAAGSKLVEYKQFIGQMGMSPLITNYAETLAWAVPTVEIIISLMLIIPRFRTAGLYSAFALMMMFTFYIVAMFASSTKLPCACGGVLSMLGWKNHLIFNIGFDLLGLTAIIFTHQLAKEKQEQEPHAGERNRTVTA
jgi:uncharacterized membrane protein YphA (DoxX/SURF4 family)